MQGRHQYDKQHSDQGIVTNCDENSLIVEMAHLCCGEPLLNGTSVLYCRKWMGPKSKEYHGVSSDAGAGILKRRWCDTPHSPPARHRSPQVGRGCCTTPLVPTKVCSRYLASMQTPCDMPLLTTNMCHRQPSTLTNIQEHV